MLDEMHACDAIFAEIFLKGEEKCKLDGETESLLDTIALCIC